MAHDRDSSVTRVQPAFKSLSTSDPSGGWIAGLLTMGSRSRSVLVRPVHPGKLLKPPVFEYECLAPADYLRWLIETPAVLSAASLANFSEDGKTYRKRASLFGGDPDTREEAIRRLAVQGRRSGKDQWHVLEGTTKVDCALFCDSVTVFIEGKRTEPKLTDKTEWYEKRNQVVRNLDCLRVETNRAPAWFVLLIVEAGTSAEKEAAVLDQGGLVVCDSLPHLSSPDRDEVWSHYLGFTTWQALAARFGLPAYPDEVGDIVAATPRG